MKDEEILRVKEPATTILGDPTIQQQINEKEEIFRIKEPATTILGDPTIQQQKMKKKEIWLKNQPLPFWGTRQSNN